MYSRLDGELGRQLSADQIEGLLAGRSLEMQSQSVQSPAGSTQWNPFAAKAAPAVAAPPVAAPAPVPVPQVSAPAPAPVASPPSSVVQVDGQSREEVDFSDALASVSQGGAVGGTPFTPPKIG